MHLTPERSAALRTLLLASLFLLISTLASAQQQPELVPEETTDDEATLVALADALHVPRASLDDVASVHVARARAIARAATLRTLAAAEHATRTRLDGERTTLDLQLSDPALQRALRERSARVVLSVSSARRIARVSLATAAASTLDLEAAMVELPVDDATARLAWLSSEAAERAAERADAERARIEQTARDLEAKEAAQVNLDRIKEQERLARTNQLKELLAEQRTVAEKVLELANQKPTRTNEIVASEKDMREAFALSRDEINVQLDHLPKEPTNAIRVASIDPIFSRVRAERSSARSERLKALDDLDATTQVVIETTRGASEAQLAHTAARARSANGETELGKAQLELAEAKLQLANLRTELAHIELDHAKFRDGLTEQKIQFYKSSVELLLPKISSDERSAFYSFTSDANISDASVGLQLAGWRVKDHLGKRLRQLSTLPGELTSVSLWAWLGGLLMRLLISLAVAYTITQQSPRFIKSVTDQALRTRTFKARPGFVIKLGEVARHIVRPLLAFGIATYTIQYVGATFSEATYLQWVVNAVTIFRLVSRTVSVIILPRGARADGEFPDLDDHPDEAVDVFPMEFRRARKLVRSAKVIIWFWLIYIYVPDLVLALVGHSIVWRAVYLASTWSFVLVMYSVLSTWRDDIARIFERLAGDRLPRAVQFVNDNKDRVWGVLVIAGASVYVAAVESVRITRRYALDTEWSKRINNFIFRKTLEYQQRDKAEEEVPEAAKLAQLPKSYRDSFCDEALLDEVFCVEREDFAGQIVSRYIEWNAHRRQGSIAVTGEWGVGKTTIINGTIERLTEACGPDATLTQLQLTEKMTTIDEARRLVCILFDLDDDVIETRAALITAINETPRRVLVLEDCHHIFLRKINGFAALEYFLEIVNLTDSYHFWILTFDRFSWTYINRVRRRAHYFGKILEIPPWTEREIEELVGNRNLVTGTTINFTDLVVARDEGEDFSYEVVKSARGYFRLLHEFSGGNPRVALTYWLRSLRTGDEEGTLQVGLFRPPPPRVTQAFADNYWFALTSIAQHGGLHPAEIAEVINAEIGFCEMAINYFQEMDVVRMDPRGRAQLTALYFRQVMRQLTDSNYLYD